MRPKDSNQSQVPKKVLTRPKRRALSWLQDEKVVIARSGSPSVPEGPGWLSRRFDGFKSQLYIVRCAPSGVGFCEDLAGVAGLMRILTSREAGRSSSKIS